MFQAKRQYFKPRSRLGFHEETQNYTKRSRSQILFSTCFVYRITSVIINQRFLQIVENITIRLIIDNKRKLYYKMSLCFVSCLSTTVNSVALALTKLQTIMLKISVSWCPGALWIVVSTCFQEFVHNFCDLASSCYFNIYWNINFTVNKR